MADLQDRAAWGSRASPLLQGFVVAGGNLVGAGLPAMASLRSGGTTGGARGSRASSLLQGVVVAGGNLVGAGLPAMASLLSGGTTGGLEDREQARSYRGLWWLADLVGAGLPAMASLRSGNVRKTLNPGAGDTPGCLLWRFQQLAASRCLVATTICGMHCAEILWRSSPLTLPCWEASRSAQS